MSDIATYAKSAKEASRVLATLSTEIKNQALENIVIKLNECSAEIFAANKIDVEQATLTGLEKPLLHRLGFDDKKLAVVSDGIKGMTKLDDPVGRVSMHTTLDDGLDLYKVACPIGVIGVIFESRPDALVQIASLCLKSGNAVLLKGGSEALNTNKALSSVIYKAGVEAGLPEGWLYLLTSRSDVDEMLKLNEYIDMIIPRGSNKFVQYILNNSSIPVLGHADGVCHLYIDENCDEEMAINLAIDSKTQNVSVCNACETILVNSKLKDSLLPKLVEALRQHGVEIFGDDTVCQLFGTEKVKQWHIEYLDLKVSMKLVDSVDEAIQHINTYGSGHTDAIVTNNKTAADKFTTGVDTGNVYVNCSTRFSDGYRYGFGAELGVSTSKLHARGPVGLDGLVTYKYKMIGHGTIVDDYCSNRKTLKFIRHNV